jgi:hypothetical protein
VNDETKATDTQDTRFVLIAAGLLVLIMGTMAVLWLRERNRRQEAERQLVETRGQLRQLLGAQVQGMLGGGAPSGPAVPVDQMQFERVTLDGEPVRAIRIPAATARPLGLRPGDVLLVSEAPATRPTTAPGEGGEGP